ncbi:MAG TPA: site-2 protease family protein [Kofleriaceae bacterium]|nr:site-2 protease family protein [Kofleriaceae bacterium]
MNLTGDQIQTIVQVLIILILSICVHEFGHAIVADKLGDPLPRSQGRTTLNPMAHADPIGTLLFPLIALVATGGHSLGFGWGKPVQVSPNHFTRRLSMRTGHMLVAAAGPTMNILFGVFISLVHLTLLRTGVLELSSPLTVPLLMAVQINFVLAFFNLIPAPPLDGGTVLEGLLPGRYLPTWHKIAVYGPFVLMAVIFIPQVRNVFLAPATWLFEWWIGLIGTIS